MGRTYHENERKSVLARITAGASVASVSKETGIPESTIRGWRKAASGTGTATQQSVATQPADAPQGWGEIEPCPEMASNEEPAPQPAAPSVSHPREVDTGETVSVVFEKRTYDVWGGPESEDGYTVNNSFNEGKITLEIPITRYNPGTPQEFFGAFPTDCQLREVFGIEDAAEIDVEGDDVLILVNIAEDGYPAGELRCVSHDSLSPIRSIVEPPAPISGGAPDDGDDSQGDDNSDGYWPRYWAWKFAVNKEIQHSRGETADVPMQDEVIAYFNTNYDPVVAASEWMKTHPLASNPPSLTDEVLLAAGQDLFAVSFANAVENAGGSFPAGSEITDLTPEQPEETILPIERNEVWDKGVATVFEAMGIDPNDTKANADALYYLIMGCIGHGVGLGDDHSAMLESAADKLGCGPIDESPGYLDSSPMDSAAEEFVAKNGHTLGLGVKRTLQAIAAEARSYFHQIKRGGDGDTIWARKDDAPEWVADLVYAAHDNGRMGADDWRYATIVEALDALEDTEEPDDIVLEPDIYTSDLTEWLGSRADRHGYVDEAVDEYGHSDSGIIGDMMAGQGKEKEEMLWAVKDFLEERIEEECE